MKTFTTTLSAAFAAILAASCAPTASLDGNWQVISAMKQDVSAAEQTPSLTILDGMRNYSGETGANIVNGTLSVEGDAIKFGDGPMTKAMADPATMEIERNYLQAIESAKKVSVNNGTMVLMDESGNEVMKLKKQ